MNARTTVTELIEALEQLADDRPDAPIRVAIQPAWPLRLTLAGVVAGPALHQHEPDETYDDPYEHDAVWLVVGTHPSSSEESPYAPRVLWDLT